VPRDGDPFVAVSDSRCPCAFPRDGLPSSNAITGCLTHPRGGAHPPNTMFILGDLHARQIVGGIKAALGDRMSVAYVTKSGCVIMTNHCNGMSNQEQQIYVRRVLENLKRAVRRGDVLALVSLNGQNTQGDAWLAEHVIEPIIKPAGAKLLLISDNPELSAPPSTCMRDLSRCQLLHDDEWTSQEKSIYRRGAEREAQMERFAAQHAGHVYVFAQTALWRRAATGAAVPGTRRLAFMDQHHLNNVGALYLSPYLCDAFERWGFFDGPTSTNDTLRDTASPVWSYPGGRR